MTVAETAASDALSADTWLSDHLDRPCFTMRTGISPSERDLELLRQDHIFVTAKVPADAITRTAELETLGFRMIETSLTFEADRIEPSEGHPGVRFVRDTDRKQVRLVAEGAFRYSRFHVDPTIALASANRIKGDWADNFFRGARGDGMIVTEVDGGVAGFLQLLWSGPQLVIDLIAVEARAARQGLARAMIGFAARYGTGDDRVPSTIRVGTQAANIPSCRLYESIGFRLSAASVVLHHHGRGAALGETL